PDTHETPAPTTTPSPTVEPNPDFMDQAAQPFAESFETLPDVIDAVAPGVVGVVNWQTYEKTQRLVEWGSGSGFVITTDGYVLTNHHVIEGAQRITVNLTTGEQFEARLVGSDKTTDIAVLKIDAAGLTALPRGDSDRLRVGEFVFAIGDPVQSELSGSVTFGIISAKSRAINIEGFTNDYIQTDAAINLGNSGGPLINMDGFVVGMNSAKTVTAGYDAMGNAIAAEGIGFALPINHVWEIATQLITTGSVPKPGIGVTIKQTRAELRELAAEEGEEIRPYIDSVTANGPAATAGMQVGDVILALDGIEMNEMEQIVAYIREHTKIGQQIAFTIEREGQTMEIVVTVGDLNKMP
ncbi:MAG: trypsin-like peptidase domain-containing protein, partial [Clostridia bacterium]|nr:trypsin-like peptidase domain-containing protein [Clostridia bacterium]